MAVAARAWGLSNFILATRCDGLALGGLLACLLGGRARADSLPAGVRARFTALSLAAPGVVLALLVCTRLVACATGPGLPLRARPRA